VRSHPGDCCARSAVVLSEPGSSLALNLC
jgi:hypothetical protein